ncbi:MAG: hypothetical protein LIP01_12675 [Tannerellaceae bacterium]|nr:hypothetical protein [Tannerellaceae bacterium]
MDREKGIEQDKKAGFVLLFYVKTIGNEKKALPLPPLLRNDNIMSNLLIKTNLVLTI